MNVELTYTIATQYLQNKLNPVSVYDYVHVSTNIFINQNFIIIDRAP